MGIEFDIRPDTRKVDVSWFADTPKGKDEQWMADALAVWHYFGDVHRMSVPFVALEIDLDIHALGSADDLVRLLQLGDVE